MISGAATGKVIRPISVVHFLSLDVAVVFPSLVSDEGTANTNHYVVCYLFFSLKVHLVSYQIRTHFNQHFL